MNTDFNISIPFLIGALRNNFGKALLTLLAVLTLAILAIFFLPRSYLSETIVFVRLGRESVSLDPTATTGSTVQVLESRESEVNSIRDMLTSRSLMELIVDTMGADVVLGDEDLPDEFNPEKILPEEDFVKSPRQEAIQMLTEEVYVISERKSSVLKIGVEASSPHLARRIMEVYLDCYKSIHTAAHQTPESNEFFEQQSEVLRDQWKSLMGELRDLKKQAGVVSIDGAQDILKAQVSETQLQYMNVESQRSSVAAKHAAIERMIENPLNVRSLRDQLTEAGADLASLEAESKEVRGQLAQLKAKAVQLNRDEVKIRQLEQEVAVAASNYTQYRELHEQTRIEAELLSNKFSNVKVIQDPSFIPKSVGPKKKLIAVAGLVAGFSSAFLVAILYEIFYGGPSAPAGRTRVVGNPGNPGLREGQDLIPNANA